MGAGFYAAGYVAQSFEHELAVARFSQDGHVDTNFPPSGVGLSGSLALQVDNRIPAVRLIAAGRAQDQNDELAVPRYWK